MSPDVLREISRKGGRAVQPSSRSFSRDANLAKSAGKKGGRSLSADKRAFRRDPSLAAAAGRKAKENARAKAALKEETTS